MTNFISVIIPTYNPDYQRLNQTITSLKNQSLAYPNWELIIIDNNSSPEVKIEMHGLPNFKIVREVKQGLTYARLKGFAEAAGDIIIMVDDDNILNSDYLNHTLTIFSTDRTLGAIGGKSIPLFEGYAPEWLHEFYGSLALRDMGNFAIIANWQKEYPASAPIGAGMGIRKIALGPYLTKVSLGTPLISDRTGKELSSGGDNDIVIEILKSGWGVGYFPELVLEHMISGERMKVNYIARLLNHTNRSWIQVLEHHAISPWPKIAPWTVPLRKLRAWFTYKAWKGTVNYIKWKGACGLFDGLAAV